MRVLHLLDPAVLRSTGYRSRTLALFQALRDQGVQTVQMAGPAGLGGGEHGNAPEFMAPCAPAWHIYRTPAPAAPRWMPHACAPMLQAALSGAALALRLHRIALLTRPDLIHVHVPAACAPAWHALASLAGARLPGAGRRPLPLVADAERRGAGRSPVAALERWALARAAALSTSSLEMRAALRGAGVACRRIAVIPPASDVIVLPPGRAHQPSGLEGAPLLAFAGRLDRASGIDLLLAALAALRTRYPALRLIVAGGGVGEDELLQHIGASTARGHVVLTGSLSARRAADVLPRADIAVFPALSGAGEALAPSRHLLNAMAQACPIVASDIACQRELLVHGHSAMLFRAGDRKSLAEVLANLLERPERCRALGMAAAEQAAQRHTWTETAACYRRLYQEVLAERRP